MPEIPGPGYPQCGVGITRTGPGSFIEVRKILPLLTAESNDSDHPSFHVVAVSLPGFGFSSAPTRKGFGLDQYAEVRITCDENEFVYLNGVQVFNKLMLTLGYDQYGKAEGSISNL